MTAFFPIGVARPFLFNSIFFFSTFLRKWPSNFFSSLRRYGVGCCKFVMEMRYMTTGRPRPVASSRGGC
eukprot:scaffold7817_cov59-Skeletonema_dohrnii-CCMP3373.AAC.1